MGWSDLQGGNLLRVEWEGEGSCLCRLRRAEEGGSWCVTPADNRFRGDMPFDPSLDTWEKVRQTCTKDKLTAPCPARRRRGKRAKCTFKSGERAPPNWRPLRNLENGDPKDTKREEFQQQPQQRKSSAGRTLSKAEKCDSMAFERGVKLNETGRPLKSAAEEDLNREAEGMIADLKKRLASAQSSLRFGSRKEKVLRWN
eukprot:jgi/Bigna1/147216/aug1.133_g21924